MANRHTQTCAVARFLNVFGDAWTLLIIREAMYGATKFSEFQRNTGIAKNLLSDRLALLVDEGLLEEVDVGTRGSRIEYTLTKKGQSLLPVYVSIVQWSNKHLWGSGNEPVHLVDRKHGHRLKQMTPKSSDGKTLGWGDVLAKPGPGSSQDARERLLAAEHANG